MLIANPKGNYSFLRGIAPYSAGIRAGDGYEIVHLRFPQPAPLSDGFDKMRSHLAQVDRPIHALCGIELRSPRPFTFAGFDQFNAGYVSVLSEWGLLIDGVNPIARTNVAPEINAPSVPSLYGFSYTIPSDTKATTFVVAGSGELPEGSLNPDELVRGGEISPDALREKTDFVMGLMSARLQGLGANWAMATAVNAYCVHSLGSFLAESLIRPMGASGIHGLTWHYSRPPIIGVEFEMDLRGCEREIVLR